MGAIASLLIDQGEIVSGSDIKENRITQWLRDKGARITLGHAAGNITFPDFVVYSTAIDQDNCELMKARQEKGIVVLRRAQMLARLMEGYTNVTVAGAHGKTTTTSMISQMMNTAGLSPTTAIGGIIEGASYNAQLGSGKYFVSEVDESDGSFLFFKPDYSVITNIDFEHVDYYHTWDNILENYRQYMDNTSSEGRLFGFGDDTRLLKLLESTGKDYLTYGFSIGNNLIAEDIRTDNFASRFNCLYNGTRLGEVILSVPGRHNIADALACILVGLALSIDFETIAASLARYRGVNRRFQVIGQVDGITVIDDYGHHPTEIRMVMETAQAVDKERLFVVFQPHRYSRLKHLMEEFAQSLSDIDNLIITDVYAANEEPLEGANALNLCRLIEKISGKSPCYLPQQEIVDHLIQNVQPGDLVLTLGAGDITRVGHEYVAALRSERINAEEGQA